MSSNIEVGYVYSFTFAEGHPDRVPAPLWWWKQPEVDLDAGEKIVQSFSIEIKEVMQREGLTTLYRSEIENGEPFNYFVNLEKSDIREGKLVETTYNDGSTVYHDEELSE